MTKNKTDLASKFHLLEEVVAAEVLEREPVIHTAALALLTRNHHVQIGVPGIAKSMSVERIVKRIAGFGEGDYFHLLMMRQMPDDKIFGPPDMGKMQTIVLKDENGAEYVREGVMRRKIQRHLPVALIAFLDEIFKCSESTLNAMLNALNERYYDDEEDGKIDIPLMSMFSASNELPESDMLDALWDRILFRHLVNPLQDMGNMATMLTSTFDPNPEPIITLDELRAAQAEVREVEIPSKVVEALINLKGTLEDASVYPTDRRWRACMDIIRAEAWMEGCSVADVLHTRPLEHVLWVKPSDSQPRKVSNAVLDLADPVERRVKDFLQDLAIWEEKYREVENSDDEETSRRRQRVEVYSKIEELEDEFKAFLKGVDSDLTKRTTQLVQQFNKRFLVLHEALMEIFGAGGRKV